MKRSSLLLLTAGTILVLAATSALAQGVTLYDREEFRGGSATFDSDVEDLGYSRIGNDRVRSVRVDRGCRAILYEDSRFRGRSTVVEYDAPDLERTEVGPGNASSLRVECSRDGWGNRGRDDDRRDEWGDRDDRGSFGHDYAWRGRKGVILYEDQDYRGREAFLSQDTDDMRHLDVGNDRASSIRVAPGCQATLFKNARFTGGSVVIEYDTPDLGRTRVGNDSVSSIEVRCRGIGGNTGADYGREYGVTVYADSDFQGTSETFDRDVADFRRTPFGNDRASSIRVSPGCVAILFRDENFRGRSVRLEGDVESLSSTAVGNDSVSSMQVDCRRRR